MTTIQEALAAHGNNKSAAARALGITRNALNWRLTKELADGPQDDVQEAPAILTFPELPDFREPIEDLIRRRTRHYERLKTHRDAATWQQIGISENAPFGLAIIGDPHLDDDGCAWPALLDDVATLRDTAGLYAVNIGDTTNNWVGRLARLFANQETSQTSARQFAEWFLTGAGIKWAGVILGNHDLWGDGGEIIRRMCAKSPVTIPVHEWAAKIELAFPGGQVCRLNLSHDFKGRSIYSTTHGPLREAIWYQEGGAHIFAAGHIHFGGLQQIELPGGRCVWLARVSGYKDFDSHALVNGFHEGQRFRSVVAIIDPSAPDHERVLMFSSIAQGARVLKMMRANFATARAKQSEQRKGRSHGASTPPKPPTERKRRTKRPAGTQGRRGKGKARPSAVPSPDRGRKGPDARRKQVRR